MKKLILLAGLFLASAVGAVMPSYDSFTNNKGLLDRVSPLQRPDGTASALNNITLDNRGELDKRNGYINVNTTGALTTSAVLGGASHTYNDGHTDFITIVGTNVYRNTNTFAGTFTNVTGTVTVTNSSSNLAQSTGLNDNRIFCNETDAPFRVPTTGNAVRLSTATYSAAKTCTTYGSYLIIGYTTESSVGYPSRIRWSDINNQESFPALNYIDVEPNDGDRIVGIVSFSDSVYIFKKKSIYIMQITGLDGPDAFIIRPFARNIGAWAKNSIKVVPGQGIFFLAQNTVYRLSASASASYNGSGLVPIGDPIQRTLDSVNRAAWANAVGEVYAKKYQYWLAVATGTASSNSLVLVYDYTQGAWTTYSGLTANMLAQAEDSTGNALLISGDTSGNIYKQDIGTVDYPRGVSTAISGSYTTADLTLGTPSFTKNFKYLYIFSQVDQTTNLTVEAAFNYSSSFDFSKTISLGQAGVLYDTGVYDQDTFPALNYKVSRLELDNSARAIKLRFSNSASGSLVGVIGWTIVYDNEDWRQ